MAQTRMKLRDLLRRFLPYYGKYKKEIAFDLCCALLTTGCEIIFPLIVRAITNQAVKDYTAITAGWVLRLEDGSELEMSLSDELLRSAVVPAGKHSLEMRFEPASYARGAALSRVCSILLILLALGAVAVMALGSGGVVALERKPLNTK